MAQHKWPNWGDIILLTGAPCPSTYNWFLGPPCKWLQKKHLKGSGQIIKIPKPECCGHSGAIPLLFSTIWGDQPAVRSL